MPTQSPADPAQSAVVAANRPGIALARTILGAVLCIAALGIAGYELATYLRTSRYEAVTAGQLWFGLHVSSLNLVQAVTQRYIHPGLWNPLLVSLLRWPLWSLLGGTGVMLMNLFAARGR